ncbi:MAG TPA: DUF2325 domain-containing protein [Syntrophales bacterium]|nr:DUF2325 domain-containing protein [Syntrophales bacterium]HQA82438.1 DUF2325 domain-containing protein [Syntrophales bacterium]
MALIGGMDRLEPDYRSEAVRQGVKLKVFTKAKIGLTASVRGVDAVVVLTGKTSHRIRNEAMKAAKSGCIPVVMCHSCGVSSLRECLRQLVSQSVGPLPHGGAMSS